MFATLGIIVGNVRLEDLYYIARALLQYLIGRFISFGGSAGFYPEHHTVNVRSMFPRLPLISKIFLCRAKDYLFELKGRSF